VIGARRRDRCVNNKEKREFIMKRLIAIAALIVAASWSQGAGAQAPYPSKLVRLICWTSAGSPLDVMMRQLGKQFGEMLNQTFVVENRPGGEGVLAMSLLAGAPADGYTILSTTSSMAFAMAASDHMKFGPADFIILPALQAEPSAVAVRADSRFRTMKDFIDAIRARPDKISVGGFSSAGFHQYVFYRLQQVGGFKSIWVPFKGGGDAAIALLGGHINVAVMTPSSGLAQLKSGEIRLLGISSPGRNEYFPDVPTFKEQGYDVVEELWRSVMVKAGTSKPVLDALMLAADKMKSTKQWQDFSTLNMQSSMEISLDAMQARVRADIAANREFLTAAGLRK
jgi:putative tricarboxylic transport membrane protein